MPYRRRRNPSEERPEDVPSSRRPARGMECSYHHLTVFTLTFFSYAFMHAARKTLSTVKPSMIDVWTHNNTGQQPIFPTNKEAEDFLAFLDFGFLIAYAFGLYIGGVLGDRYNPRKVLAIGMWLSAIVIFNFGYVTEYFRLYSRPLYAVLWISAGLFQSVGWPTEVCIVGNWFGRGSRGIVLGAWSGCASVGNIIGTIISSRVLFYGYQIAFAINSTVLFVFGFVVYFCLHSTPREVGLPEPVEWEGDHDEVIEVVDHPRPVTFLRAWKLPGVIPYSSAYACLKLVNYGFFFWLPYYLHSHHGWSEGDSDNLSTFYDCGGIVAAIAGGALSDRMSSRTPVVFIMLLISSVCLGVYSVFPGDYYLNAFMLSVVGFFVGGPANMISSSISADLGKARELHGSAEALSTVTGIVDGTGSVGAALGQLLIPLAQQALGWNAVFYGFIVMVLCTAACIFPILYHEIRESRNLVVIDDEEEGERRHLLANSEE